MFEKHFCPGQISGLTEFCQDIAFAKKVENGESHDEVKHLFSYELVHDLGSVLNRGYFFISRFSAHTLTLTQ